MLKRMLIATLAALTVVPTIVTAANAKDPARKEFSACEVKTTRPYNSILLYKNRKFKEGNPRYTADIYKLYANSKSTQYVTIFYNLKDKGKIVANFQFAYKPQKAKNLTDPSTQSQTQLPGTDSNSNRVVWNTIFSACGPRAKNQSYPVISYLFYDTYIGLKLNGYRAPINLGQVTSPNPLKLVNVINQLDGPDFGN
jgi:hypothetical protein